MTTGVIVDHSVGDMATPDHYGRPTRGAGQKRATKYVAGCEARRGIHPQL